jgi:hypothetical protein
MSDFPLLLRGSQCPDYGLHNAEWRVGLTRHAAIPRKRQACFFKLGTQPMDAGDGLKDLAEIRSCWASVMSSHAFFLTWA